MKLCIPICGELPHLRPTFILSVTPQFGISLKVIKWTRLTKNDYRWNCTSVKISNLMMGFCYSKQQLSKSFQIKMISKRNYMSLTFILKAIPSPMIKLMSIPIYLRYCPFFTVLSLKRASEGEGGRVFKPP